MSGLKIPYQINAQILRFWDVSLKNTFTYFVTYRSNSSHMEGAVSEKKLSNAANADWDVSSTSVGTQTVDIAQTVRVYPEFHFLDSLTQEKHEIYLSWNTYYFSISINFPYCWQKSGNIWKALIQFWAVLTGIRVTVFSNELNFFPFPSVLIEDSSTNHLIG